MHPERDDIAAPDLPDLRWIGDEPESMPVLTAAGPALVHFVELAQINSVRTIPYINEWDRRYRELGVDTILIQAPRFPFAADPDAVAAAAARLGIEVPIAIDANHELWTIYGCTGWPSLFLWRQGGALAWFHFGEGEYAGTEEAIQAELREADALRQLPAPVEPLRAGEGPGARVMPPSDELFPGGSWERPWTAGEDGEELEVAYEAGGAHITVEGDGALLVELDGEPLGAIEVTGPGLYELAEHPRHERHALVLRPAPGQRIWSVGFSAGVP